MAEYVKCLDCCRAITYPNERVVLAFAIFVAPTEPNFFRAVSGYAMMPGSELAQNLNAVHCITHDGLSGRNEPRK